MFRRFVESRWSGFFVFSLALLLRLSLISTARFTGDESLFYSIIHGIATGRAYPVLGPPISGGVAKHPGAGFYYLMSLSQWFSPTPEAANAEVAILGALGVWLFWSALRRAFREKLGPMAVFVPPLFMAVAPWSVLFADRIWNSNVIGFFVALAFWAAVQIREDSKSRWIAVFVFACAAMPQFHLSAPIVWVGLMILIWPFRHQWNWKYAAVGTLAGLMLYVPYLHYEFSSGFANLAAYRAESAQGHAFQGYRAFWYLFQFLTNDTAYHEMMGYWGGLNETHAFIHSFIGTPAKPFHVLRLLSYCASLVFGFQVYRAAWRNRGLLGDFIRALLGASFADFLLLTVTGKAFYPHYVQPLLPFVFVLIVAWVVESATLSSKRLNWRILIFLLAFAGGIDSSLAISRNLDARNGLAFQRRVVERILDDSRREHWPANAVVRIQQTFPIGIQGYPVLLRDVYHSRIRVVSGSQGKARATYLLTDPHNDSHPVIRRTK